MSSLKWSKQLSFFLAAPKLGFVVISEIDFLRNLSMVSDLLLLSVEFICSFEEEVKYSLEVYGVDYS